MSSEFKDYTPALRPQSVLDERTALQVIPNLLPPPPEPQKEYTIEDIIKLVQKHLFLIIGMTLITTAAAIAYILFAPKKYTATSTVRISTYRPVLSNSARESELREQTAEDTYFETEVADLQSYPVADKVLQNKKVKKLLKKYDVELVEEAEDISIDPSISSYINSSKKLEAYLKLITVSPVRNTALVKVAATTTSPQLSAFLANEHARSFISLTSDNIKSDDGESVAFLESQVAELRDKIELKEDELAEFAKENALVAMESEGKLATTQLEKLNDLLEDASRNRINLEKRYESAKKAISAGSTMIDDESISKLREALTESQAEYAELSQKFAESYPKMRELKKKVLSLRRQMLEQRKSVLSGLKAEYDAAVEIEEALKNKFKALNDTSFGLAKAQVEYNRMKREYDSMKELLQNILVQLQETKISDGARTDNISIAAQASVPFKPSWPDRKIILVLSLVLGPMAGFGLGLIKELFNTRLQNPEDLEGLLSVPELGIIPNFEETAQIEQYKSRKRPESEEKSVTTVNYPGLISASQPFGYASESFRMLRTSVRLTSTDFKERFSLMITSSDQGEGKSTVASNLAHMFAQEGSRTILIDTDLRRPTIHEKFSMSDNNVGLAEALTGQVDFRSAIVTSAIENLDVIVAGGAVPNPAELIGSSKMMELVELLKKEYDAVILDAPPVMPVTDSLVLSNIVDRVVVVCRSGVTIKDRLKKTVIKLSSTHSKICGVVFNDARSQGRGGYKRSDYYKKGAYYGNERWGKVA